ncbi:MAG: branched-chain amino acid ABC transporter substrate-binding protein [Parvibaculaceae bacterium]
MRNSITSFLAAIAVCLGAGAARADIPIATVGPMTGQYAAFGEQLRRGAELAVADINAAGGVDGEKLVLDVGDDACDPKQAAAVAGDMAARGVRFVAGHFCSGASIPASKIYEQAGILQISPASTNPKFTDDGGWNVARVCGRDDAQGVAAGNVIARDYRDRRIAIIHDGTVYGKGLADAVRTALNAAGVKEAFLDAYTPGGKDYTPLASRLAGAAVDVVYVGGSPAEGGLILRELRELGSPALMVAADTFASDDFWRIAGAAGDGTIMTFAPDPQKFDAAREVVARFKAAGYDPEGATLYAYAAVQAYAQAVAAAGGAADNRKLAEWLRSGAALKTVLGRISLDRKGDVRDARYVWYRWHDGDFAEDAELSRY